MLLVWVDAWQMQCCGDPFAVGSRVAWTLSEPDREWLASDADGWHPETDDVRFTGYLVDVRRAER